MIREKKNSRVGAVQYVWQWLDFLFIMYYNLMTKKNLLISYLFIWIIVLIIWIVAKSMWAFDPVVEEPVISILEIPEKTEEIALDVIGERVCATFTDEFVKKYRYSDSKWYNFALKINWYYYNVLRNENWWVSNSISHWLTGAVPAYLFNEEYCRDIMHWEIKVANKDSYWFHYMQYDSMREFGISTVKEWVKTHNLSLAPIYAE